MKAPSNSLRNKLSVIVLVAAFATATAVIPAAAQSDALNQQYRGAATIPTNSNAVVPPLVRFSGTLTDFNSKPVTGIVGVTFSLYKDEQGGAPLWIETQNVTADKNGHYTVMLGSTTSTGLPADIFVAGDAHWIGVQPDGQTEQPRVLLLSVPYALKAGDAQTLGGLPASAFVQAAQPAVSGSGAIPSAASASAPKSSRTTSDVTTTGGTVNTLPLFSTATNIQNSAITQTGSGTTAKIGINSTTPSATLYVNGGTTLNGLFTMPTTGTATATAGKNSQPQDFVASVYNSSTATAVPQKFQWQAEAVNNDTATASGTINLLYASGSAAPAETGLHIGSNGQISFATGQAFPGASELAGNNTYTGTQTINNTTTITGTNTNGVLQVTNTTTSGGAPAIVGLADSTGASGLKGLAAATAGITNGVLGFGVSAGGYGVQGDSPNVGVYGQSDGASNTGELIGSTSGVWGDTGGAANSAYSGILGTADENFAGYFNNNSSDTQTVYMENNAESSSSAIVLQTFGSNFDGSCTINVSGDLKCSGTVSAAVSADNGARKVSLYAMQSAENWFEDAGSGQLTNGSARVTLDPAFASTVNTGVEYHVFLTPNGDCQGLYVSQKSATSFEVHELGGGHSSISFDYRIMAKRIGYENVRLADVSAHYQQMEQQQKLRRQLLQQRRAARPATVPIATIASPAHK